MLAQPELQNKKPRRTVRACNECKIKKAKCDEGDGTRCTRCINHKISCVRREVPKKEERKDEIQALKERVQQMEDILQARTKAPVPPRSEASTSSTSTSVHATTQPPYLFSTLGEPDITYEGQGDDSGDDVHSGKDPLPTGRSLILQEWGNAFVGKSSGLVFLEKALEIKRSIANRSQEALPPEPWFCSTLPSEEETPPFYSFPDPDLLLSLIELYFQYIDIFFPVLHRPSFEANVASGLHFRNSQFAELVLLVSAAGSRYSDDPRVLLDDNGEHKWLSCGWKWFSQVDLLPKTMRVSGLYGLQKLCLASSFIYGTSTPQVVWTIVGVGLRLAQERGIHRQKRPGHRWTIEDELWKRTFWVLLCIERVSCSVVGRPCSLHDEDFDVELPVICDDEYWNTAKLDDPLVPAPEGSISRQAFFVTMIRLTNILAFMLRTIYAVGKFKSFLARSNPHWQEEVVHQIDSALNKWRDTVPEFLKWPSKHPNTILYHQSSALTLTYHYIQMQTHRPFIPSIGGHSVLSQSSLIICASAARSCCHIFEELCKNPSRVVQPFAGPLALTSGVILLLYIWESEKFGLPVNAVRERKNVRHCLDYMNMLKHRISVATKLGALLHYLLCQEEQSNANASSGPSWVFNSHNGDSTVSASQAGAPVVLAEPLQTTDNPLAFWDSMPGIPDTAQPTSSTMGIFRITGDHYTPGWDLNDLTMLQGLNREDEYYRDMLSSFEFPHIPSLLGHNMPNPDQPTESTWGDPTNSIF